MKTDLGPDYLHAEDLLVDGEWKRFALTVKAVHDKNTIKSGDGKLIDKYILEFQETAKRLVMGSTNVRLATCAVGTSKVSKWVGRKLSIYAAQGNWFGQKDVAAIRIAVPAGRARPFVTAAVMGKDLTGTKVQGE